LIGTNTFLSIVNFDSTSAITINTGGISYSSAGTVVTGNGVALVGDLVFANGWTVSGAVSLNGAVWVTGAFSWTGGSITGSGTFDISGGDVTLAPGLASVIEIPTTITNCGYLFIDSLTLGADFSTSCQTTEFNQVASVVVACFSCTTAANSNTWTFGGRGDLFFGTGTTSFGPNFVGSPDIHFKIDSKTVWQRMNFARGFEISSPDVTAWAHDQRTSFLYSDIPDPNNPGLTLRADYGYSYLFIDLQFTWDITNNGVSPFTTAVYTYDPQPSQTPPYTVMPDAAHVGYRSGRVSCRTDTSDAPQNSLYFYASASSLAPAAMFVLAVLALLI
jgi:hypothetical protein